MKTTLALVLILLSVITLKAQPHQGRGGGRPDGTPPEGMRQRPQINGDDKMILEYFPEIPNLSLTQREKVGSILTKERKDIAKQLDKKRNLEIGYKELTEKDREKNKEKIEKIEVKINQIKEKSNQKIKKELSEKQYSVFKEKREDFKFKHHRGNRPDPMNREQTKQSSSEVEAFDFEF